MAGLNFWALADASAILFGIFGLVLVYLARDVDLWPRSLCVAILSSTIAVAILSLLQRAAGMDSMPPVVAQGILLAAALLAPLPSLLVFAYFLYCCGEEPLKSRILRAMMVLTIILWVSELLAQLTGEIAPGPDGLRTQLGPCLILGLLADAALIVVSLAALFRKRHKLTRFQRLMFLACFLTSASIQIILVELYMMASLVQRYLEQKEETLRQSTQVAVLQMRPHFIHNTLMSVYYLCVQNPKKAQRVIRDFTRYLQNNFTAMVQEGTIPFSEELEHTRAYLAVEQIRFEGRLFVEFDTPNTFFRLPPLTLQPIVENAVRYGLDPDLEPLYISVVTEDTDKGVRVTVEDTGPGYSPLEDDRPHFALDNIRERLKTMCGGTLEIEQREAGGTKVTIFVPWKQA